MTVYDCYECISHKLDLIISQKKIKHVVIVGEEPSSSEEGPVKNMLIKNGVKIYRQPTINLVEQIGAYTNNPKTPYLIVYNREKLIVSSL